MQHWEQGISKPAEYLIKLLEKDIGADEDIMTFSYKGKYYKYSLTRKQLSDYKGSIVNIDIKDIKTSRNDNVGLRKLKKAIVKKFGLNEYAHKEVESDDIKIW